MKVLSASILWAVLLACQKAGTAFEPNRPVMRKKASRRKMQGTTISHRHPFNSAAVTGVHPSLLPPTKRVNYNDASTKSSTISEYWFDQRIHSLGNTGISGALHAAMAVAVTKLIDLVAYDGVNVREQVCRRLAERVPAQAKIADLCCGVGTSTRALSTSFPKAQELIGVDTSAEMVSMARFMVAHLAEASRIMSGKQHEWFRANDARVAALKDQLQFKKVNAEQTELPSKSFDLVTIMYGFHEIPLEGRDKILTESKRLLQRGALLAVVDITADYIPSKSMLAGEPYVLEYQRNIHNQLGKAKGFMLKSYESLVPGHVGMWLLEKI